MLTRSAGLWLVIIFIVAAGTRVGWVVARHGSNPDALTFPDEDAYRLAGRSLAAGTGVVDEFGYRATYMPAYPAFIAMFEYLHLPLIWLRLTQAVLGALVAPATFLLARRWTLLVWPGQGDLSKRPPHNPPPSQGGVWGGSSFRQSRPSPNALPDGERGHGMGSRCLGIPALAGLAAAVDPFLIFFSGLLLTETLFAAVLIATWWLVFALIDDTTRDCGTGVSLVPAPARRRCHTVPVLTGLLLVGCIMLRPSSTILVVIVPLLVVLYRRFAPAAWLSAGVVVAVVILGLFPWAVRNANVLGEWRWTTTRGGISLYDGLQPNATGASDLAHTKTDPAAVGLSELAWDRYWHDQAMAAIRQDPGRVIALAGRKLLRTWNIVPNEAGHRQGVAAIISAVWTVGVLAAAAIGWWHVRRAARWWIALLVPVVAFTALHMIYIGSVRYRIPVMPMLFVLAAAGVWLLIARVGPASCRSFARVKGRSCCACGPTPNVPDSGSEAPGSGPSATGGPSP